MVSILPLISSFSNTLSKSLGTVWSRQQQISITVTLMITILLLLEFFSHDSSQYSGRFNDVGLCIVPTCPLFPKSSSPLTNLLGIVPSAPITIGISATFLFLWFFSSLARTTYLSLFSFTFTFTVVCWYSKVYYSANCLFLLINPRSGRVADIRWSVCISKSQRSLDVSFSMTDSYTICLNGQISISCTDPSRSTCPPSHV